MVSRLNASLFYHTCAQIYEELAAAAAAGNNVPCSDFLVSRKERERATHIGAALFPPTRASIKKYKISNCFFSLFCTFIKPRTLAQEGTQKSTAKSNRTQIIDVFFAGNRDARAMSLFLIFLLREAKNHRKEK